MRWPITRPEPLGQHPDQADAVIGEAEDRRRRDGQHDRDQHGRDLRSQRCSTRIRTIPVIPNTAAAAANCAWQPDLRHHPPMGDPGGL